MTETVGDFYGDDSPSPQLSGGSSGSSRRSSPQESTGSGRHHYRPAALASVPERKSTVATATTMVGATRNRPASLSPFRPGSRSKRDEERDDRCSRSGGSRSPKLADNNCSDSNPGGSSSSSSGSIWRHPSSSLTVESTPMPSTSSSSSGLFNWRKKYPRRSSSSSVVPTSSLFSSCVGAQPSEPPAVTTNSNSSRTAKQNSSPQGRPSAVPVPAPPPVPAPTRRNSQPAAFSLPQLVRRSLQPLISSSPSTDVDDQSESVTKLRYMKCKQVVDYVYCIHLYFGGFKSRPPNPVLRAHYRRLNDPFGYIRPQYRVVCDATLGKRRPTGWPSQRGIASTS